MMGVNMKIKGLPLALALLGGVYEATEIHDYRESSWLSVALFPSLSIKPR